MDLTYQAGALCNLLRDRQPIIHCITNSVTINDCANAALAIGASPIMADAPEEADAVTAHAQALVLNIGQLSPRKLDAMLRAGQQATRMGIPVVLDPVGAGVSSLRTSAVRRILESVRVSILRCNRSEAACIYGMHPNNTGIDSDHSISISDGETLAHRLAARYHCTVALTGETDLVANAMHLYQLEGGHKMLSRVTGMGCIATVLCAAYAAVSEDNLSAAVAGLGAISAAGEIAFQTAGHLGTGSFHIAVMDALSLMDAQTLSAHLKLSEVDYANTL